MDYQTMKESHQQLSLSECDILKACLKVCSKEEFLYQMHIIIENTREPILKQTASRLVDKIIPLNDTAFSQLYHDVKNDTVYFPPNYNLPI